MVAFYKIAEALSEIAGGSKHTCWSTVAALTAVANNKELLQELESGLLKLGSATASKRRALKEQMAVLDERDKAEKEAFIQAMRLRFAETLGNYP